MVRNGGTAAIAMRNGRIVERGYKRRWRASLQSVLTQRNGPEDKSLSLEGKEAEQKSKDEGAEESITVPKPSFSLETALDRIVNTFAVGGEIKNP